MECRTGQHRYTAGRDSSEVSNGYLSLAHAPRNPFNYRPIEQRTKRGQGAEYKDSNCVVSR